MNNLTPNLKMGIPYKNPVQPVYSRPRAYVDMIKFEMRSAVTLTIGNFFKLVVRPFEEMTGLSVYVRKTSNEEKKLMSTFTVTIHKPKKINDLVLFINQAKTWKSKSIKFERFSYLEAGLDVRIENWEEMSEKEHIDALAAVIAHEFLPWRKTHLNAENEQVRWINAITASERIDRDGHVDVDIVRKDLHNFNYAIGNLNRDPGPIKLKDGTEWEAGEPKRPVMPTDRYMSLYVKRTATVKREQEPEQVDRDESFKDVEPIDRSMWSARIELGLRNEALGKIITSEGIRFELLGDFFYTKKAAVVPDRDLLKWSTAGNTEFNGPKRQALKDLSRVFGLENFGAAFPHAASI